MNRLLFIAITAVAAIAALSDQVDARHRLRRIQCCECCECCTCPCPCPCVQKCEHQATKVKGSKGFWPFTNGDEEVVTPDEFVDPVTPEPLPEPPLPEPPVPQPAPDIHPPAPDVHPDPTPLPPEPTPSPKPDSVVPKDPAEANVFISRELGGHCQANATRNGALIDIWQSRGKQRVAWAVGDCQDWRTVVIRALIAKNAGGSNVGGVALICHCPFDPAPAPSPTPEPTPAPEPLPVPEPTPVTNRLAKFGGEDLVIAEAVCRSAGLWLVVVRDTTGDIHRVIYGNTPKPVTSKWKSVKK